MNAQTHSITVDRDILVPAAIGIAFFLSMAILGIVGELLGWWNQEGYLLAVTGIAATALTAIFTLLVGATKDQVRDTGAGIRDEIHATRTEIRDEVRGTREEVRGTREEVRGARQDIVEGNRKLDVHTELLTQIRDRLPPPQSTPPPG